MSQQCSFKNNSPCGSSQYYASSEEVIHILKCEKPVSQHLRGLSCDTDLQIPEGLLILYRYGNYSLDSSTLEKYICPKHRDNLGIYWRRQQRRCQSTFHPTNSHAKVERGIQVQVAKEIWMESGVYIPVGAGICNACRRRHLPRSEEGKKIIQRDIDQFMRFSACSKTYSLPEDSFSQTSNGQEINSQNICSIDTEESQSQSDKFSSIAGNTQNSSQDWYELQKTPREKLNAAMKILSESFEPITSQLTKKWEETSKSARSYYTKKARECIELVLSIMAPCQEDILLEKIQINSTQEIKLDNMTASVMEAFQKTSDSRTQTQILSIIVNNHTKTELQTLIPGLTINKIDSARKHALVSGPGTILNQPKIYRMKLSKPKVLDPFAQDQPISGKLKKFADNRIEDTHDHDDLQPSLDMLEEDQPISENSMNISTCSTSSAYFSCPDFSCDKVFATSSNLDRHLLLGNHNYRKNTISSMDTAVQIYSSSCIDLQKYHENVIQEASHEVEVSVNLTDKSRRGWGLKSKSIGGFRGGAQGARAPPFWENIWLLI